MKLDATRIVTSVRKSCPECGRVIPMKREGCPPLVKYYYYCEHCGYISPKCSSTAEAQKEYGKNASKLYKEILQRMEADTDKKDAKLSDENRSRITARENERLKAENRELIAQLRKADEEIVRLKDMTSYLWKRIEEMREKGNEQNQTEECGRVADDP